MQIDLRQIFELEGESLELTHSLDLSHVEFSSLNPFESPVEISAKICNRSNIVTIHYTAQFTMKYLCDRCLSEQTKDWKMCFEHVLVHRLFGDNTDEYILVEGYMLNLSELVESDILLELPTKMLCKEDCKGLCQKCGKDLNEGECNCETGYVT
jgi:uncharacterized protein